jgi:uncharacterized integral membrane protein
MNENRFVILSEAKNPWRRKAPSVSPRRGFAATGMSPPGADALCICDFGAAALHSGQPVAAMFKAVLKTFFLLIILFVMLYVGMNNTEEIDFNFPIAGTTAKEPIHTSAALIFFGVFAAGVLAGTMLHSGGGGGSKKSGGSKEK